MITRTVMKPAVEYETCGFSQPPHDQDWIESVLLHKILVLVHTKFLYDIKLVHTFSIDR